MKARLLYIPAIGGALVAGALFLTTRSDEDAGTTAADTAPASGPAPQRKPESRPTEKVKKPPRPAPAPAPLPHRNVEPDVPERKPSSVNKEAGALSEAQQRAAMIRMWNRAAKRFDQLREQLDSTQDPQQRSQLINRMAQYVRMNTLDTIEWAMGLEDPEERRMAMEAINDYALSGIGARINVDHTGFPRIEDTTVLSAVASSGRVEPGDYIIGMMDAEGQMIDFENMPVQRIVQHLRGEPGSELLLLMERGGDGDPYDVPVQRSLLVIQPPY